MTGADDAASPPRAHGDPIVRRYPVADTTFVSSAAGMWRLELEKRRPPLATSDIAAVLEAMIGPLRRLDDIEGGSAAAVGMVNDQIQTITTYLTRGRTTSPDVRQRLLLANAELNQLAGWMAFDAERHGTAQRYFRTGLAAARNLDHAELTAHILACMSYQAVHCGRLTEAAELAEAAVATAKDGHPLVKSLSTARLAHARAALGDEPGFRLATAETMELFDQAKSAGGRPDYLYWLNSPMDICAVTGQSALLLTGSISADVKSLLAEADELLTPATPSNVDSRPRDALFQAAWLARAHVRHGDLRRAVLITDTALHHRGSVRSPRALAVLRRLEKDLADRRDAQALPEVRALGHQLRELRPG